MNAPDVLGVLRSMGLTVTVAANQLVVTPKERITELARTLIRANKPALLQALTLPEELEWLISLVAQHYHCPPDEIALMRQTAMEHQQDALECFRAMAARWPGETLH